LAFAPTSLRWLVDGVAVSYRFVWVEIALAQRSTF
jgi:hypothetical protein